MSHVTVRRKRHHHRRHRRARPQRLVTRPFAAIVKAGPAIDDWLARRGRRLRHKYRRSSRLRAAVAFLLWGAWLPARLTLWAIAAPVRVGQHILTAVGESRYRRQIVHMIQGLPALLLGVGVIVLGVVLHQQQDALPPAYQQRAIKDYDAGNYEAARLSIERVFRLGAGSDRMSYFLARTLEQTGETTRAAAILDSLAPESSDVRGYPQAHLWKAEMLARDPDTYQSEERLRSLHRHLLKARAALADDVEFNILWGRFHLATGDLREAVRALEQAARHRGELEYNVWALHRALQNDAAADRAAQRALPVYQARLSRDPQDRQARLAVTELLLETNDYQQGAEVLQAGISLDPDGPFQEALANAHIRRYDELAAQLHPRPDVLLKLLSRALTLDPKNRHAFQRLLRLGEGDSADGGARHQAKKLLEQMVAVGASAPLAHFALGIGAWTQDEMDDALWHLERAYELDSSMAKLGNNLAWALTFGESPDYERALRLIDSVLNQHPDVPEYIETRGQILAKLGCWDKALDDLERVLPTFNENAQLHETLALVYRRLGRDRLAAIHEQIVDKLRGGTSS